MHRAALALALTLLSALALAERAEQAGDIRIDYNAIPSSFLSDDQARAAGVLRSRTQGVLLVSVKRGATPIGARVSASMAEPKGERRAIPLHEVSSQGVPSYLGGFPFKNGETRHFRLEVTPEGAAEAQVIEFSQTLFSE